MKTTKESRLAIRVDSLSMYTMSYSTHSSQRKDIAMEADLKEQHKWFQVGASKPEGLAAPIIIIIIVIITSSDDIQPSTVFSDQ